MKQTVVRDGHVYALEKDAPDLGSITCTRNEGNKREYVGLSKDVQKLPKYDDLESGSSCLMIDTTELYMYEKTTKTWYKL